MQYCRVAIKESEEKNMAKKKKVVEEVIQEVVNKEEVQEQVISEETVQQEEPTQEPTQEPSEEEVQEEVQEEEPSEEENELEKLMTMFSELDNIAEHDERLALIKDYLSLINQADDELSNILLALLKKHCTELELKEVNYKVWLDNFNSKDTPEDVKAGKEFTLYTTRNAEISENEVTSSSGKTQKVKSVTLKKLASRKVSPRALDKTFEKNVTKSQAYLQNIRDEITYNTLEKQEEKLIQKDVRTAEQDEELQKTQDKLAELKLRREKFMDTFGSPSFDDVLDDMLAFITAWVVNPEKGFETVDTSTGNKVYSIHFENQEKITNMLIKYFVTYLDKPDTEEKIAFKRELKNELEKFCNGWLEYDKDGKPSREVKRMAKKFDIGYKNTYIRFNDEMVTLASAYCYAGFNDKTNKHMWKNSYTVIQHLFKIALAWTFGVFDKEELRQETSTTKRRSI